MIAHLDLRMRTDVKLDKFKEAALSRYSDRVKSETERIQQLELDDLKVFRQSFFLFLFYFGRYPGSFYA